MATKKNAVWSSLQCPKYFKNCFYCYYPFCFFQASVKVIVRHAVPVSRGILESQASNENDLVLSADDFFSFSQFAEIEDYLFYWSCETIMTTICDCSFADET